MKCSVYIATSVDGYIATPSGEVEWLESAAGDSNSDMAANPDMGFQKFISSVDFMIMGRKCMDAIAQMNLSAEQWPYGDLYIVVLSRSVMLPPESLKDRVVMYSGDVRELVQGLERKGFKHAYIDGGSTITSFLNLKLITEMTITKAPVLLGVGISLFGSISSDVKLQNATSTAFPNNFVQTKYEVKYL